MFLIFLPVITSRCRYVFDFIFTEELGVSYEITTDLARFEKYDLGKLNYSHARDLDEFHVKASPLLFEEGIKQIDVSLKKKLETTVLFANAAGCDVGFDIFSAVFYMLSRYEEYLPFTPDKFGRFESGASLASRGKFLQQPVVNTWIDIFKDILLEKFPYLKIKPCSFDYLSTYDIDIAYAFKGRSILRHFASTINDAIQFKFKNILRRLQSFSAVKKDPFDLYQWLQETIEENKIPAIFFFLLADYSSYDKNISYRHPLMKELIRKVSSFSELGIHPSFNTLTAPKKISVEKGRLENLSGKEIHKSRQHYLRFKLPDTYNHLITAGITEDYSMGFADMPGFRAGSCKPFYFYDLKNEKATALKLFPVTVMEGSFINYLQIGPAEALEQIVNLVDEVHKVNGLFISIWHNHTLSNINQYKGWKDVHDKMLKQIVSYA